MDHKKTAIWILTVTILSIMLNAGQIENNTDKARLGLAQSLISIGDVNEATEIIEDLYSRYPDNKDIITQYIVLLSDRQQYDKAIDICRRYIGNKDQDQGEIKLWLARLLSWNRQYEQSVQLYSELIEEYPGSSIYAREKARVLGWDRKYDQAIDQYRLAAGLYPDNTEISYEMQAKHSLYNQFYNSAIPHYKQWLDGEPENIEALYDLAQVYSTQGRWTDAEEMYGLVLEQYGSHFRAAEALEKVRLYSRSPRLTTGFEYFEADSSGRTMDKRYWDTFAAIEKPFNENISLNLRQDNIWYSFNNFKQVYQQKFGLDMQYSDRPCFKASANFSTSIYGNKKGVKNLFGGSIDLQPIDELTILLSHQRHQVTDNSMVFLDKLYRDDYKTRLIYKPYRRLSAGADYTHSAYSDNNSRNMYGFDLGYYLSLEPSSIKLSYRYEQYNFSRSDSDYFSPDSFHSNRIGLEFRQFLNKEELFWGSNDTYYAARYEIILEARQQRGHKISADFHHDWNSRCSSRIEWSKTIYEHSSIYSENRLMFNTSLYF